MSPTEQRQRIGDACERDGLTLRDVFEELDVSGGAPLERRSGLVRAIQAVEEGDADVIVVAYFDRLVRSLRVQAEVVERVEKAGGSILAVDVGEVRADTASRWLSATMLGMVAEYQRRSTAERVSGAQERAVARGVPPFARIPPGLRKRRDGTLEHDPRTADAVREAFALREEGASHAQLLTFLREHGIDLAWPSAVGDMLRQRLYVGELRFGKLVNPSAVEPLIDEATFRRVQRLRLPRGRHPKSERLLSRLGLLRCSACGARMVVSARRTAPGAAVYRCPTLNCDLRPRIKAEIVEDAVKEAVQMLLKGVSETVTDDESTEQARAELERIDAELEAAVEAFSGFDDVPATRERLSALRDEREALVDKLDELEREAGRSITVSAEDWDLMTLDERRALVTATLSRIDVGPGQGAERVKVHALGE